LDDKEIGISVLVHHPYVGSIEGYGWVRGLYCLGLVSVGDGSYLIDEFGVGSRDPIEEGGIYYQPVYQIYDEKEIISFRSLALGFIPINQDSLRSLKFDKSVDLSRFIVQSSVGYARLQQWVSFIKEARYGDEPTT